MQKDKEVKSGNGNDSGDTSENGKDKTGRCDTNHNRLSVSRRMQLQNDALEKIKEALTGKIKE